MCKKDVLPEGSIFGAFKRNRMKFQVLLVKFLEKLVNTVSPAKIDAACVYGGSKKSRFSLSQLTRTVYNTDDKFIDKNCFKHKYSCKNLKIYIL